MQDREEGFNDDSSFDAEQIDQVIDLTSGMSNPWISPSGTPGRESPGLESTSSKSLLLQSIYGSQTSQLLNAMSSQLVIEEESEDDLSEDEYVPQTSKVSARPKSSPASAIAARRKLPRPQTAVASSTVQRRTPTGSTSNIISSVMTACSTRRLSRPTSAKPQLQSSSTGVRPRRPASASVRPGNSSSNLASSSGIIKPTQTASQKKITRPKSAFVGSSMSVPMLDYDPLYEENVASTRAPLPTSGIVHRTDAPEYFNFWEGKPLSERGGMVIHERKQWKRPKSDYGSRYYTRTKSASSRKNSNNLDKVVEAWGDGDQQVGDLDPWSGGQRGCGLSGREKDRGGSYSSALNGIRPLGGGDGWQVGVSSEKTGEGRKRDKPLNNHTCKSVHVTKTVKSVRAKVKKKSNATKPKFLLRKRAENEAPLRHMVESRAQCVNESAKETFVESEGRAKEETSEKESVQDKLEKKCVAFSGVESQSLLSDECGVVATDKSMNAKESTDRRACGLSARLREENYDLLLQRVRTSRKGGGKGDGGTDHGLIGQGDLMKDLLSGSDLNKGNNDDKYRNRDTSENDRNRKAYRSGAHSDSRYGKPIIEEEDEGIDDDYFQKSEDDKLPQVPSSTSITSSLSGTDLVNDISTTDLDRSPVAVVTNGYNSHVYNKENEGITIEKLPPIVTPKSIETPTTTIDSSDRILCLNINSDDDDDDDKPISMDWLKMRLALTKHSTRFELPLELKRLEGLTPMEYLQMYCVISDRRAVHYSKIFNKFVKYPSQVLARVDLIPALIEVHYGSADKEQMECVLMVVDLPPETKEITLRLFAGISALAERMLRQSTLPSTSVLSEYGQRREIVEDADFEALEWKLRGCTITDALRNLFAQL